MYLFTRLNLLSLSSLCYVLTANAAAPQDIISFDVVANDGLIHALVASKLANKKTAVHYLVSKNNAKQWHSTTLSHDSSSLAIRGNDVQLAVAGKNRVALWQVQGELPNMGALLSYYSHDSGKTWHKGKNPAADDIGDQSHSDVLADKQGNFHAVWLSDPEEKGYQSLHYARSVDGGEHWQTPQKLDDSTCSCCWNTLAIAPSGVLNVLYRDMRPRDMALLQSSNQGDTWQRLGTVGEFNWQFDGCPHIGGGLAIANDNTLHSTVWTGVDGKAGLYTLHSKDNGKTWTTPLALGKIASHSDIALNGQQIAAVWDEREADGMGVFVAKSQDGGITWSKPKRLSKAGIMATHPRIISNAQGFVTLWTEKANKQPSVWRIQPLEN